MDYKIKDIKLASQGEKNIQWAESQMGALLKIRQEFKKKKPLKGTAIGMALHVTKETAALVKTLIAGGAEVAVASCNPLSTQDDVAAALAEDGIRVFAHKGETKKEYYDHLNSVVKFLRSYAKTGRKLITIDDGCDLVSIIHGTNVDLISQIIGGAEETTTGIIRLKAMEADRALKYPMVAVNESNTKHLMDNYLGTGQSTIDGILRASNILFAGKTVVICGFGECGKGVARRAQGMGANVVVCEVDHFRALQALTEGYRVMPIKEAAKAGDVFITVTGNKHIIDKKHFRLMKDGVILANSGHFDLEINVSVLEKIATKKEKIRPFLDRYVVEGKNLYLAGEGRLVNLAAAEGHPSTIISMSFANQSLACKFLVDNQGKLENKVYILPKKIDDYIAKLQLEALGVKIDKMTLEQKKYSQSWQEGT